MRAGAPSDAAAMTHLPSGLAYVDLALGTGPVPRVGQTVRIAYTAWLPEGRKFDATRDQGRLFEFPLGEGLVIPGWDEAVATMREGGKRKLIVPSALAFGPRSVHGAVPPDTPLTYEIELLAVLN